MSHNMQRQVGIYALICVYIHCMRIFMHASQVLNGLSSPFSLCTFNHFLPGLNHYCAEGFLIFPFPSAHLTTSCPVSTTTVQRVSYFSLFPLHIQPLSARSQPLLCRGILTFLFSLCTSNHFLPGLNHYCAEGFLLFPFPSAHLSIFSYWLKPNILIKCRYIKDYL